MATHTAARCAVCQQNRALAGSFLPDQARPHPFSAGLTLTCIAVGHAHDALPRGAQQYTNDALPCSLGGSRIVIHDGKEDRRVDHHLRNGCHHCNQLCGLWACLTPLSRYANRRYSQARSRTVCRRLVRRNKWLCGVPVGDLVLKVVGPSGGGTCWQSVREGGEVN